MINQIGIQALFDLAGYAHSAFLNQFTYPWEAVAALERYLKNVQGNIHLHQIPQGAYLAMPESIYLGEGTVIEPGCFIQGPCILGKNCQIRHGAYIRGNLLAGDGCVIGHATEIKNAILLNHVHAAHFAYVGDSLIGNHVNLGAGVKCANLKLDRSEIIIRTPEGKIPTGMRKLGALLGDASQIACNAVINPGTVVGRDVFWFACVNAGGIIPEKSWVTAAGTAKKLPS